MAKIREKKAIRLFFVFFLLIHLELSDAIENIEPVFNLKRVTQKNSGRGINKYTGTRH